MSGVSAVSDPVSDLWVYCGHLGRPNGVSGALRLWPHNPQTTLLRPGASLCVAPPLADEEKRDHIELPKAQITTYTITALRRDAKGVVVRLAEIKTREEAQALNLHTWVARREAFAAIAEDEVYFSDLIGAQGVLDDGRPLGPLVDVLHNGATELLVFSGHEGGEEVMVPYVLDVFILKVDLQARVVTVRAVPGLLEGGL
jgi:16S rRNA processing protein RimM